MEKLREWIITSYPESFSCKHWRTIEMKQLSFETTDLERSGQQASSGNICAGLRWHIGMLQIISEVAGRLLASDNPQDIVDQLCLKVMKFLDCDVFLNYLINHDLHCLNLNAFAGIPDKIAADMKTLDFGVAVCGCVARDGEMIVAENIFENQDPRTDLVKSLGIQAYACHPLRIRSRIFGTLSFGSRYRAHFVQDELDVMKTVADHIAFAIDRIGKEQERNSKLLEEIAGRKKTEERLRSAQKNLRAMASEIVLSDERSRQHFAADLHDSVVQTLGAAKLRMQLLRDHIKPEGLKMMSDLQDMITQSISQARFIMAEMSPPVLNELGFIPALEWLAEQIESQHGIPVNFSSKKSSHRMVHEIQVLLFQAVRELLMNVVKHSRAKQVFLIVSERAGKIRIEVKDDGIGMNKRNAFRSDLSSGFGLFSIRERLKHFGGQLKIKSEHGKGTTVLIQAPKGEGNGNKDYHS